MDKKEPPGDIVSGGNLIIEFLSFLFLHFCAACSSGRIRTTLHTSAHDPRPKRSGSRQQNNFPKTAAAKRRRVETFLIRREIRNKIVLRKSSPPSLCDSPRDLLPRPSKQPSGTRPQLRRTSLSRKTGVLPFCFPLLLIVRASILAFNCLKTKYRILFSPYPKTAGWESDRQVINRHYTKRLLLCQPFL